MGIQPILPIIGPIRQCYSDSDGVVRCEQTLTRTVMGGKWVGSYNFNFIQGISFFISQTIYSTLKCKVPTDFKYHIFIFTGNIMCLYF